MADRVGEVEALCEEFEHIHGRTIQGRPIQAGPVKGGPITFDPAQRRPDMADYRAGVQALAEGQSALCLSGGGVRSAAFSLGVLQGLARRGLLPQFHYLSTVSGGGYIGSWLVAWLHRRACASEAAGGTAADAIGDVMAELTQRRDADTRESAPLRWLRQNQRFLNARAGMMSGDLWAGIALFLRDLLLNWLVYLPAIAACLLVPRLFEYALIYWGTIADNAGSAFGWLIQAVLLAPVRWLRGDPQPDLHIPRWPGFLDAVGAFFVLIGMRYSMLQRTRTSPDAAHHGRAPKQIDDRVFRWQILLPLLIGSWLAIMFTMTILVHDVDPDGTLLAEWCIGVPLVFVVARIFATGGWPPRPVTPSPAIALELLYLALSGAVAGLTIWVGMKLRFSVVGSYATVHDLVVFGLPWMLMAFVMGQIAYAGLSSTAKFGRRDQEWLGRASGHYLLAGVAWTTLFGLIVFGHPLQDRFWSLLALSGTAGALTLSAAFSTLTKAQNAIDTAKHWLGATILLKLGLFIFLVGACVTLQTVTEAAIANQSGVALNEVGDGLSLKLHAIEHLGELEQSGSRPVVRAVRAGLRRDSALAFVIALVAALVLLLVSLVAAIFVDVNLFSLHGLYRNRLIRSFLGASNNEDQNRNRFDGFDANDDIPLAQIWRDKEEKIRREGPFPVLNMALNMVGSEDRAVQDRKAVSFTATPLRYGSGRVGYVTHNLKGRRQNLSLGTAMAISGAAASPNWGYHSSPLVSFVLMLFNLRLGWWMQNPKRTGGRPAPERSSRLFVQEVLGRTSDEDPYVYLSDGGHFDNLGVYEMFRRRCSLIVAIDGTQDQDYTLEDLGRALRTAAVDLGASVDFGQILLRKRADPAAAGVYAAIGTITYAEQQAPARPARFIYIKPGLLADAPADVRAYGAANSRFPHDSTLNQFFSESQFESYRALGEHVIQKICGATPADDLNTLTALVETYLHENTPALAAKV